MKKKSTILTIATGLLMIVLTACGPDEDPISHLTDGVVVTTHNPEYISATAAICGAEVAADDMGLMIELGVCWSQSEKPTIDDNVYQTNKCSKPFNCILSDLKPDTKYYVRGYALYGTEYCYGDEKTFTTLNDTIFGGNPYVTTLPAENITYCSFLIGGKITIPDDLNINLHYWFLGLCVSTSPNPTIENSEYVLAPFDEITENTFNSYFFDREPNTQYYYRAFLAYGDDYYYYNYNQLNFLYGDILSVTTPEIPWFIELNTYYPELAYWDNNAIIAKGDLHCSKPQIVDEVGFCYSMESAFPQYESDLIATVGTPTNDYYDFEKYLYDLSANTKYYIRTFARYKTDSIRYGNVVEFYSF